MITDGGTVYQKLLSSALPTAKDGNTPAPAPTALPKGTPFVPAAQLLPYLVTAQSQTPAPAKTPAPITFSQNEKELEEMCELAEEVSRKAELEKLRRLECNKIPRASPSPNAKSGSAATTAPTAAPAAADVQADSPPMDASRAISALYKALFALFVDSSAAYITQHTHNITAHKMAKLSNEKPLLEAAQDTARLIAKEAADAVPKSISSIVSDSVEKANKANKRKHQSENDELRSMVHKLQADAVKRKAKRLKVQQQVQSLKSPKENGAKEPGANQKNVQSTKSTNQSCNRKPKARSSQGTSEPNPTMQEPPAQKRRQRISKERTKSNPTGGEDTLGKGKGAAALAASSIRKKFGFVPDPSSSSFRNAVRARASSLPGAPILPTPSNLAFHDLTDGQIAPKAAKSLLGLGSKFIVTPRTTTGSLEATSDRDFFIKIIFAGGDEPALADDTHKRSKLYVKSDWNPTECDVPNWACLRLSRFLNRVQRLFRERRAQSNLLPHQEALLKSLHEDPLLLFPETDKGLGPCSVTFDQYVEDCLIHLRNQQCYTRLSEEEAMAEVVLLEDKLEKWLDKHELTIGRMATKYIRKHLGANRKSPFGQFYILYKIHKGQKNGRWPTRPVCSDVTSLTHAVGKWVNEMLTPVQQAQESYFQDSFALKKMLDEMEVPPNALLFTSDATAMYTNIRTEPALEKISEYLRENAKAFNHNKFDTEALIAALHLVFENNLFKLGDTFWKQILGTAMGTPPAPPWATIFFALKEMGLLPKWSTFLHFYKRFIDDVLGVWLVHPDPEYNKKMWLEFQADMNSWFGLEWVCTDLATSVNFMDLTITIADGHLETTLFEKAQNLYLYIPPHSSPSSRRLHWLDLWSSPSNSTSLLKTVGC
ncbi:LOW QUALITY PROTEIN: hypothetical protein ACHAWO_007252 [Cyclotella atomus]|uniref:Reverse transcriptase domain-containing protein n=1 Tax=Cyclotella atomus TaxID=382360 RepID=A0ABD3PEA9_9STRA